MFARNPFWVLALAAAMVPVFGSARADDQLWIGLYFFEDRPTVPEGPRSGAVVRYVFQGSPADLAGIRAEDSLFAVDGVAVTEPESALSALRAASAKSSCIRLGIVRAMSTVSVSCLRPAHKPPPLSAAELKNVAEKMAPVVTILTGPLKPGRYSLMGRSLGEVLERAGADSLSNTPVYRIFQEGQEPALVSCLSFEQAEKLAPASYNILCCEPPCPDFGSSFPQAHMWHFRDVAASQLAIHPTATGKGKLVSVTIRAGDRSEVARPGDFVGQEHEEILEDVEGDCIGLRVLARTRKVCSTGPP